MYFNGFYVIDQHKVFLCVHYVIQSDWKAIFKFGHRLFSAVFLGCNDAAYSLIFSYKPLEPLQNSWIYVELKLNTTQITK